MNKKLIAAILATLLGISMLAAVACAKTPEPQTDSEPTQASDPAACAWRTGSFTTNDANLVVAEDGTAQTVEDFCLACHRDGVDNFKLTWEQIKKATSNYAGFEQLNPHDSHLNSDGIACNACHQEGHELVLICSNCHFVE